METKLTKDNIAKVVEQEGDKFKSEDLKIIKRTLKKDFNKLSGKFLTLDSGGYFFHMFFQLKDFNWIGFHSSDINNITITSKPYKTNKSFENAFFGDSYDTITEKYYNPGKIKKADFLAAKKIIVQWCKEKNKDISFLYPRGK